MIPNQRIIMRCKNLAVCLTSVCLCASVVPDLHAQEPWSTYRGNAQRTASTDGQAGPASPKVLWALKSKDHYIASAVPAGDKLFISGLGAFNTAQFVCLSTDPKAVKRELWSKTTPF